MTLTEETEADKASVGSKAPSVAADDDVAEKGESLGEPVPDSSTKGSKNGSKHSSRGELSSNISSREGKFEPKRVRLATNG